MTVIAEIPYKDGVLIVADSRATLATPLFVNYIDDEQKVYVAPDKEVTVAIAGSAVLGKDTAKALIKCKSLLQQYCMAKDNSQEKQNLEDTIAYVLNGASKDGNVGFSGLLVSVRLPDNTTKIFTIWVGALGTGTARDVRFVQDSKNDALGVDRTVPIYLNDLVKQNCPDKDKRDLADAMAIAFMLEDAYMEEHYPIKNGLKKIYGVGGAIRAHAMNNTGDQIDILINKSGRKQIENKSYSELKQFFAEKLAEAERQKAAQTASQTAAADLLRTGNEDKEAENKTKSKS
jgi:hypothetical protein